MDASKRTSANQLWAMKMLFLWRKRLGYWDWDAFCAAWCMPPAKSKPHA